MEAMVGTRRSLRSHPTLALPYCRWGGNSFPRWSRCHQDCL